MFLIRNTLPLQCFSNLDTFVANDTKLEFIVSTWNSEINLLNQNLNALLEINVGFRKPPGCVTAQKLNFPQDKLQVVFVQCTIWITVFPLFEFISSATGNYTKKSSVLMKSISVLRSVFRGQTSKLLRLWLHLTLDATLPNQFLFFFYTYTAISISETNAELHGKVVLSE